MAVPVLKYAAGNSASTTLSSSISSSDTSAPLTSDTNFQAAPTPGEGQIILGEGTASEELSYATGKSGSSLTIPLVNRGLEGTSAAAQASGNTVKGILTVGMWNDMITALLNAFVQSTGAVDTTKVVTPSATQVITNKFIDIKPPRGFLINGKIVTSVASSDLTVAIKGIDGNDPSATNPVYVRIGDTVRSITSALSVTKNDGTNWFNSGAAGTATVDMDYFVYLGYNATDGVVIGFSRISHARIYSDFSATTTNDRYCAISTITTAAATDEYEVIGRFNAILSAGAGYTWSLPATSIVISRPIFESRWIQYTPTLTGFSANPTTPIVRFKVLPNLCIFQYKDAADGTSNSTDKTIQLPLSVGANAASSMAVTTINDNSNQGYGRHLVTAGATTVTCYPSATVQNWTGSGNCRLGVNGTGFQYEL